MGDRNHESRFESRPNSLKAQGDMPGATPFSSTGKRVTAEL
jgi:hypothetical protein